eukprot:14680155-Ditylum_brightwellii.AAC.1
MKVPEELVGAQKCMSPSQHTRYHKAQPTSKNHGLLFQTGYVTPPSVMLYGIHGNVCTYTQQWQYVTALRLYHNRN